MKFFLYCCVSVSFGSVIANLTVLSTIFFIITPSAYLISNNSSLLIWFVKLCTFANRNKVIFCLVLLNPVKLNFGSLLTFYLGSFWHHRSFLVMDLMANWLFLSLFLHLNHGCSSSLLVLLLIVIGILLHHHHCTHQCFFSVNFLSSTLCLSTSSS